RWIAQQPGPCSWRTIDQAGGRIIVKLPKPAANNGLSGATRIPAKTNARRNDRCVHTGKGAVLTELNVGAVGNILGARKPGLCRSSACKRSGKVCKTVGLAHGI